MFYISFMNAIFIEHSLPHYSPTIDHYNNNILRTFSVYPSL